MMQDLLSLKQALNNATLEVLLNETLAQVKSHPEDLKAREVLFKLYSISGAWDKALMQLQTLALMDAERKKQIELYKNMVFSEMQRKLVLTGEKEAATLQGNMPVWLTKLHQANSEHYRGETMQAVASREAAFDMAEEAAGKSETLGEFSWIADSDSRLGPVCEFICAGGYRWVPYADIRRMNVQKPDDLLDLLWLPAEIQIGEENYYGYIPARYPAEQTDDQETKLGLKTEYQQHSEMLLAGSGRKVLITNNNEQSIMEVGEIVFE